MLRLLPLLYLVRTSNKIRFTKMKKKIIVIVDLGLQIDFHFYK